jgi:hypothetical protein
MNRIPVGQTIAQAYGFAFGRYFTILGIVWVPMLISLAMVYFFRLQPLEHAHPGTIDPAAARVSFLVQIVGVVLFAIMSVGINKEVLGLPRGSRFFYIGFGGAEGRVIGGFFALALLFIVFVLAFFVAVSVLNVIARIIEGQTALGVARLLLVLLLILLAAAIWLALIYAAVRLTFLLVPATVAEHRIGILSSWQLTAGNFWRIVAIGICVLLPFVIVVLCAAVAVLGSGYISFVAQHAHDPQAIQAYVAQRMAAFEPYMPVMLVGSFVANPVLYGLIVSPAAFAYRALVPSIPLPEATAAGPIV